MSDKKMIYLDDAIDALEHEYRCGAVVDHCGLETAIDIIHGLPPAEPEYKPVEAEDFAKTMSENSLYNFVAWHQEALTLMKEQGFMICKKTTQSTDRRYNNECKNMR